MADSDPTARHRRVADRFTEVVGGVTDWDGPSPVPEWRARDVVGHLVSWFPPFLADGAGIDLGVGPSTDDDPVGAWRHQATALQAALEDPATAERVLANPHIGEVPLPDAIDRFYTSDVLMHTWDLARASGQADALDADECAALLAGMEPMEEVLRGSGQYGAAVPVDPDADVQTRLIAFIGRDPAWRP